MDSNPRCRELSVLVIRPHHQELRTSGADGFTEAPFCRDTIARPVRPVVNEK
jgi:hypothetical protein